MCHGIKKNDDKPKRKPKHVNAQPYNRSKYKEDFRNYDE